MVLLVVFFYSDIRQYHFALTFGRFAFFFFVLFFSDVYHNCCNILTVLPERILNIVISQLSMSLLGTD